MARATYVLLPSPLVGPATWEPVAAQLRTSGVEALVADPSIPTHPDQVLAAFLETARSVPGAVVLVPHSNAGYYAPSVAEAVDAAATVYVDAALSPPDGSTRLAPVELESLLVPLVDDEGLLPPWSQWWDDDVEALFPDQETRHRVEAAMPRIPLAYFRESLPVPSGWEAFPNAYLAFGDTYAPELTRAETLGWPVDRLDAPHLFPLWDPPTTATAILGLGDRLR